MAHLYECIGGLFFRRKIGKIRGEVMNEKEN